jgi:hypothetical protein
MGSLNPNIEDIEMYSGKTTSRIKRGITIV